MQIFLNTGVQILQKRCQELQGVIPRKTKPNDIKNLHKLTCAGLTGKWTGGIAEGLWTAITVHFIFIFRSYLSYISQLLLLLLLQVNPLCQEFLLIHVFSARTPW